MKIFKSKMDWSSVRGKVYVVAMSISIICFIMSHRANDKNKTSGARMKPSNAVQQWIGDAGLKRIVDMKVQNLM